ncbi:hypothetical protein [Nocardia arthritidis]|uniref:Uncharacterized protein n=1 Tax=Nocardia arthritidis TaxID=228602 RepID=A0A6G9YKZ5_9NOCA|nr:hypothetical protein [Nocardia arthritidis]QIS13603.1 hypothetical protein F5544_28760 [Nocardia arthritidis]
MHDESNVAQARVFHELLTVEAAALQSALRATVTKRGMPRHVTERRRLERDLREVRRCLDQLRGSFPELADGRRGPDLISPAEGGR